MRADQNGVLSPETLIPHLLILLLLLTFPFLFVRSSKRHASRLFLFSFAFGLGLSLWAAIFATIPTVYASPEIFWHEARACIAKGLLAGGLSGLAVAGLMLRFAPLPSRTLRWMTGLVAGMTGISMLSFHCDSSSWSHLFLAHWGSTLIVITAIGSLFALVFRYKVRRILGKSGSAHLRNISRL